MLKNSPTFGFNYLKWQNLTGATFKCTWSRGVAATFSWELTLKTPRIHLQWLGKAQSTEKGAQTNCWNTDVRAASGLQRGNTTEVTLQRRPKARSVGTQRKPLLFLEPCTSYFSLSNGKKQCLTGNGAVQKTADATTLSYWNEKQIAALLLFQVLMTHRDAMFNHHTSWGGIIKHLKRSF